MMYKTIRKINISSLQMILIHLALYFAFYLIFSFFGFFKGYPTDESLMRLDTGWYRSIIEHGYNFNPDGQSNVAFFPLFPLIWKYTGLSPFGMSVLNFIFFAIGMVFLRKTFQFSDKEFLILLSIPSLMFCYVPYSEAVFFMSGSMLLYGLDKDFRLALLGIFISSTIRSASMVFIPIILFTKLYYYDPKGSNKKLWLETLGLILATAIATIIAQYYVFLQSGKFFGIFEAQKHWGRILSWPKFFLSSWANAFRIWIDGLAFLVGLLSAGIALHYLWKRIRHKPEAKPSFLFSIGYLALVTLTTLLYSGDGTKYTLMLSLNRFIFAVPFFSVLLIWWIQHGKINKTSWFFFIGANIVTWVSFAPPEHYFYLDKFELFFDTGVAYVLIVFAYSIIFFLLANKEIKTNIWSGLYVLNIMIQIYLFNQFINGEWVG